MPYLLTPVSGFPLNFSSFLFCVAFFPVHCGATKAILSGLGWGRRGAGFRLGEGLLEAAPPPPPPDGAHAEMGRLAAPLRESLRAVPEFSTRWVPDESRCEECARGQESVGTRRERVAVSTRALPLSQAPPTGDLAPTKGDTNPRVGGGGGPGLGAARIKVPRAWLRLGFLLAALRLLATCWLRGAASLGYFVPRSVRRRPVVPLVAILGSEGRRREGPLARLSGSV